MKRLSLFMIAALAIVATSCNTDESILGNKVGEFGAPSLVDISLVNHEAPSKAIDGSEEGEPDENKVTSLEFYVFDDSGTFPDPEVGKTETQTGNGYVRIEGQGLNLNQRIRVSAGADKKFLVVANAEVGPLKDVGSRKETYEELKARISSGQFIVTESGSNTREIPGKGLEMSGYNNSVTIDEGSNGNQVYITIRRLASKINAPEVKATKLELKTKEQIEAIWGEGTEVTLDKDIFFEFKGYALVNGVDKSNVSFVGNDLQYYLDPDGTPWAAWTLGNEKKRIESKFNNEGFYTSNYSGKVGDNWFLDGKKVDNAHRVYVYENKPEETTVSGTPGYDLKSVYAFIIEGEVTTEGEDPETRYWRVDLTKDDVFHIMRNCVYKVTVNKITSPGYGTPKEAEEKPGIVPIPGDTAADFVIKVAQWDINKYETGM